MATVLITTLFVLFASVRITRAITLDKITDPLREWVIRRNGADGWWTYLFHCPWCVGFWVSLPAAAALWWLGGMWMWVALPWYFGATAVWFTLAYLTGWVISKEDR